MKRVLIITYYWPPSGGAGVQRWLKFTKYLRDFGWEPVIYTPENPEAPAIDESLKADIPENLEVIKTRIREPYTWYKKFVGRDKDDRIKTGFLAEKEVPSVAEKIAVWIRGNLFIPDARKYWIKPSVKFLTKYIKKNPVDAIVSTGPPHSMHLIALGLKKRLNIPWLADFRDPWTNIDFYDELRLTRASDLKHRRLEKAVLRSADAVVVIGKGMEIDFTGILKRSYKIITNGYDFEVQPESIKLDTKFSIGHIGSINKARNPTVLWESLKELCGENQNLADDLEIKLVGQVDYSVINSLNEYNLIDLVKIEKYLEHHDMLKNQMQMQVLLLLINRSPNAKLVVTGKLFEYLISGRPIICIGPALGDAASIISETKAGVTVDFDDKNELKRIIRRYYRSYKGNNLKINAKGLEKYSRRSLTHELAMELERISMNG